jgi:hypothetical protein
MYGVASSKLTDNEPCGRFYTAPRSRRTFVLWIRPFWPDGCHRLAVKRDGFVVKRQKRRCQTKLNDILDPLDVVFVKRRPDLAGLVGQ